MTTDQTARIAILGWGSLLWDLDNLTPHVRGGWARAAGPRLPLEFSRVSPKRKMGLAVIVDIEHGADCPVSLIESAKREVEGAVADLAARERAPLDRIGFVDRASGRSAAHAAVADRVGAWCQSEGWDGAVWTDLPANFHDHTGEAFSLDRAAAYLRGLAGDSLAEAHRYIENAPAETDTPLRRRLRDDPWWAGLRAAT